MRRLILLLAPYLCLLLSATTYGQSGQHNQAPNTFPKSGSVSLDPISVTVENGQIVFDKLSLTIETDFGLGKLEGLIINKTGRNWINLFFEVDLLDAQGNEVKNNAANLIVRSLKRDSSKLLSEGLGAHLLYLDTPNAAKIRIRFATGSYPAVYSFSLLKPHPNPKLVYDDPFVSVAFDISKRQIGFILVNKTSEPIKIDWNQVSYIDIQKNSHKVMHKGVKYINRDETQSPSIIPPTARLEDLVFPTDYLTYTSGEYGGWDEEPMFPEGPKAGAYKGQSFSVFMPMQVNGVVKNYLFTFHIDNVEM
jgi:hypothetical protein